MTDERIHRTTTDEGIEVVGSVHGHGPPLVLVHGPAADGDSEWAPLLPPLTERFTCYLPSTRGRGLSTPGPRYSRQDNVADLTAFVESIGEPVGLVGVSGGGMLSFGVAARCSEVRALAAHEPVVLEAMDEETAERLGDLLDAFDEAVSEGRWVDAASDFFTFITNDEELAALSGDPEGAEEAARYADIDLVEFRESTGAEGWSPTDPSVLARIDVPVLLTRSSRTSQDWFTASVRFAAEHLRDAEVRVIDGAGHLAHLVEPERVAAELIPFLEGAMQPV